jgi:hypothetical protein
MFVEGHIAGGWRVFPGHAVHASTSTSSR